MPRSEDRTYSSESLFGGETGDNLPVEVPSGVQCSRSIRASGRLGAAFELPLDVGARQW